MEVMQQNNLGCLVVSKMFPLESRHCSEKSENHCEKLMGSHVALVNGVAAAAPLAQGLTLRPSADLVPNKS